MRNATVGVHFSRESVSDSGGPDGSRCTRILVGHLLLQAYSGYPLHIEMTIMAYSHILVSRVLDKIKGS